MSAALASPPRRWGASMAQGTDAVGVDARAALARPADAIVTAVVAWRSRGGVGRAHPTVFGTIRRHPLADIFARTTMGPPRTRSRRQAARPAYGGAAGSALARGDARHPAVA